ncbi:DUF2225 domain-containing protein [Falsibacillus albus]|uniref:DUF2225 domain-containing protein n=1 Tax=Falsibacillus albus TaxID=2478915 RepID=A0A3L7K0G0_9BACI|nr:DUF2225 domain-containing protein [Falsibacillus albus]RLQ96526.1 DUF2225 domain-containing protein [Falsibacillus albus]
MLEITPFYKKTITCPLCKNGYQTTKIRSRFVKVENLDSDFCPNYQAPASINPILYNVHVCPSCGYSSTEDFNTFFVPVIKEALIEKVSNAWKPRDYGGQRDIPTAITTYKLAVICGLHRREKKVTIAGLYLRIAWLYRLLEQKDCENRFMGLAAKEYTQSYSEDDYKGTQMSEERILYMIAELYRRLDQNEEAVRYFSRVIEKQQHSMDKKVIELAKEQWHEMKEKYRHSKSG